MADAKKIVGGLGKVTKALLADGEEAVTAAQRAEAGRKAAALIKSQPQVKASEALGQQMEKGMKRTTTTQADRTRVGGGNIGGAPFSAISEADPAYAGKVWGVMDSNTAKRLTNLTTPETAWTTMLGSANQLKTNPIVFDKLKRQFIDSMKQGNLSPELEAKINHNLALTFGEGAQIRDPKIWRQADTFEKRAALADLMMGQGIQPSKGGVALGGEKSGKGVIFRPTDTLKRETEPSLLHTEHGGDVPTFAAGPRLFKLEKESVYRPDLHPGFPTLLTGKDLNVNMIPTPTEIYLPDWHKQFKKNNPDRKPSYYDLALGVKGEGLPSQDLNDEYIRHLIREGFKDGGAVDIDAADRRLSAAIQKRMAKGGEVDIEAADARLADAIAKRTGMAEGGEVGFKKIQFMGKGGKLVKGIAQVGKKLMADDVLPAAEREANLAKFLDTSHEKRRLYHATPSDFKEFQGKGFDPTISGNATWLTPNKEKQPAAHNTSSRTQVYREGVNVMPVHVKAERPLVLDDRNMEDWAKAVYANDSPEFPFLIAPDWLKKIKEDGYDSIFHPRSGEVIMLEPNKIKSAIGNRGTYNIEEADITKADGGKIIRGLGKVGKKLMADAPAESKIIQAPTIMLPSKLSTVREGVRGIKGNYGAKRVERAADEIPNLEKMFQEGALGEAFTGDNARGLMTINPADFEKYAQELSKRTSVGPKAAELAKQGDIDKHTVPTDEYIKYLQQLSDGFSDVPYLNLYKNEVGLPTQPKILGHEGRHRNRSLADKGETAALVQVNPRGDLREGMPRRTQEEFIEALKEELERSNRLVIPESEPYFLRPSIKLPDVYATGGKIVKGGLNLAKRLMADNPLPAIERDANLAKFLEPSKIPQRLYHGTTATEGGKGQEAIRRIKPSKEGALGSGVYTTPNTPHASSYTGIPNDEALAMMSQGNDYTKKMADQFMADRASGRLREGQAGGNMLPVHVQMRNPLIIGKSGRNIDPAADALMSLGMDEESAIKLVERAFEEKGNIGKQIQSRAQAQGYDGIMQYRGDDLSEVVSYNPNAVKSAIGNRGTYDINEADLSKAHGGLAMAKGGKLAALGKIGKRLLADPTAPRSVSEGDIVNGMLVRKDIPNTSSIGASLSNYSTHGLQEVPMSAFQTVGKPKYYSAQEEKRTKELARQIQENKELNPLIVVKDAEGHYILEGGHRFDALRELGIDSFPALMVHDLESLAKQLPVAPVSKAHGGLTMASGGKPAGGESIQDALKNIQNYSVLGQNTPRKPNELGGVVLSGASWLAGDEKTRLAKQAFGQDVTNTAVGGYKTADVLNQLNVFERDGGTFAPGTTVVLDIGANDIATGVDPAITRRNLDELVSRLGDSGVQIIMSAQPFANSFQEAIDNPNLVMNEMYSDIASNNPHVTLVDAMSGMLNQKDLMDESGFHLNSDDAKLAYINKFADAYKTNNPTTQVETGIPEQIAQIAQTGNLVNTPQQVEQVTQTGTSVDIPQEIAQITQVDKPEERYTPEAQIDFAPAVIEREPSAGYSYAQQNQGLDNYYQVINDYLAQERSQDEIKAAMEQYGVSQADIDSARDFQPSGGGKTDESYATESYSDGGAAFKKIQFMDKGGITTSAGLFSPEELGVNASDIGMSDKRWNTIKRNAANLYGEGKEQLEKEYRQLGSKGGKKDFAIRVGSQFLGGVPDLINLGLEGIDLAQSFIPAISKPESVLDTAGTGDRIPKFKLASEKPFLGSQQFIDKFKEAELLGDKEFPLTELVAGFAAPAAAVGALRKSKQAYKGAKSLIDTPKKRRGGLTAMAR